MMRDGLDYLTKRPRPFSPMVVSRIMFDRLMDLAAAGDESAKAWLSQVTVSEKTPTTAR